MSAYQLLSVYLYERETLDGYVNISGLMLMLKRWILRLRIPCNLGMPWTAFSVRNC